MQSSDPSCYVSKQERLSARVAERCEPRRQRNGFIIGADTDQLRREVRYGLYDSHRIRPTQGGVKKDRNTRVFDRTEQIVKRIFGQDARVNNGNTIQTS